MSLFASQFQYAPSYQIGLDTGTPQVGATAGSKPKEENSDPNSGAKTGASIAASAAAAGAASNAISKEAANSNGKAAANSQSLSNQGTLNKLTHMESNNANSVNAANPVPETNTYRSDNSMFDTPAGGTPAEHTSPSPSTVNRPSATTVGSQWQVQKQSTPSWSQDWHTIAHGYDNVVNGLSQAFPLPGTSSQNNVGHSSTDSHVTEPSNVWNPSESSQMYTSNNGVGSGASGPGAVGSGSQNAIEMGPYSQQFRASFGLDTAKHMQGMQENAASNNLMDGIDNLLKNPGEIFSDL